MATKRKTPEPSKAQFSAKKNKPRGRAFAPGNPWRIPKGMTLNPGGKPKLLSHAYRDWLAAEDDEGVTNAAKVSLAVGLKAAQGDIQAAKEIRQVTEGDHLTVDLGKLTDEQLERIDRGEDLQIVLAVAGGSGARAAPADAGAEPAPGPVANPSPAA